MKYLKRELYLSRIRPFYDDFGTIKVLTGIRRCGKSVLLQQISEEIKEKNPKAVCLSLNLDQRPYKSINSAKELEDIIDSMIPKNKSPIYLFIDEVQNVQDFEKSINAYREEGNFSIFITGSNSYLLSGELITKLTGRFIEFKINTFSYSESIAWKKLNSIPLENDDFLDYMRWGGFPKRFEYQSSESIQIYLQSIYDEIIKKDILRQKKIKNKSLMERCIQFLMTTPGATISVPSIRRYLLNEESKTTDKTVANYIQYALDAKLCDKVMQYDLKGRKSLLLYFKTYLADVAFKSLSSQNPKSMDYGALLENIVYKELIARGYSVSVGKYKNYEIDFIIRKGESVAYIQVCYLLGNPSESTFQREVRPLQMIRDNYPKFILSMDPLPNDYYGIKCLRVVEDFLLNPGNLLVI